MRCTGGGILDKSNRTDKYSAADFLANAGIPTLIDAQHAISHNKVIIVDGETVIGGSFNYTKAAQEKKAENVEITRDKAAAAKFTANWQAHARHSEPYVGRGVRRCGDVPRAQTGVREGNENIHGLDDRRTVDGFRVIVVCDTWANHADSPGLRLH